MEARLYKTIFEIAKVINSSLEPAKVLDRIVEQTTEAMNAKGCFVRLLDKNGSTLLPDASFGLSARYAKKGPVEVAKSRLDQEVLDGKLVYVADARSDDRFQYPKEAANEGLSSVIVAPLKARGDRAIGVIRVYASEQREFTPEEMDFLSCIADLSGLALENARMFHALKRASELAYEYNYQVFED